MRRHRCATSCLGGQLQNAGQQGLIRHMTTLDKHHQSLHTLWDQIIIPILGHQLVAQWTQLLLLSQLSYSTTRRLYEWCNAAGDQLQIQPEIRLAYRSDAFPDLRAYNQCR